MSVLETSITAHGIATLTLNRPEKHNALDAATIQALHAALLDVQDRRDVRIVVLTGAGVSFCAGGDIAQMQSLARASQADNVADALALARCLRTLDELRKPVIARVNGNAFGGGIGLIACADIAIAIDSAKFALTEVRLGLVPAIISPYVLRALGGARQARRLFLTAEPFDARQARALGLLHFTATAQDLDDCVDAQAALLLRGGPTAVGAAKQLIARMVGVRHHESDLEETARLLAELRASDEGQEGLSAFLERRPPTWGKTP